MPLLKDKEPPRIRADTESRWQAQAAQLSEEAKEKLRKQAEVLQPYDKTYLSIVSRYKFGIGTEILQQDFLADICGADFSEKHATQTFFSIDAKFRSMGWVIDGQFPQDLEGGRFKIEEGRHIKPEFYSPLREILMQRRQQTSS